MSAKSSEARKTCAPPGADSVLIKLLRRHSELVGRAYELLNAGRRDRARDVFREAACAAGHVQRFLLDHAPDETATRAQFLLSEGNCWYGACEFDLALQVLAAACALDRGSVTEKLAQDALKEIRRVFPARVPQYTTLSEQSPITRNDEMSGTRAVSFDTVYYVNNTQRRPYAMRRGSSARAPDLMNNKVEKLIVVGGDNPTNRDAV